MISSEEQELLNQLTAWTLGLGDAAFLHQHVVDAWAAQNAANDAKPITIAFALIGLYLSIEKGYSGREVQRVHMWLAQPGGRGEGRKQWPRFTTPSARGSMSVADVMSAPENERTRFIERWCRSVWESWGESHEAVRRWTESELEKPSFRK